MMKPNLIRLTHSVRITESKSDVANTTTVRIRELSLYELNSYSSMYISIAWNKYIPNELREMI